MNTLKAVQEIPTNVKVSDRELIAATTAMVYRKNNLSPAYFLRRGDVFCEPYDSRLDPTLVRLATAGDIAAFELIASLEKYTRSM